jgi:TolB protein
VYQPSWSKDGDHILYVRDNALWITGVDSGQPEKVLDLFSEGEDLFGFYGYISCQNFMAWSQP